MNARRSFLPALAALGLVAAAAVPVSFTFDRASTMRVEGTSSVHDWHCTATGFTGTFRGDADGAALAAVNDLVVTVPVSALDCKNGTMNGKMREALKASANPTIRFTVPSARPAAATGDRFNVTTAGQLTLAGVTRPLSVTAQGQALSGGRFRFTGSAPVSMSAFEMRPPTAMMGTIRTGDRVTVRFDVTVRP